jgi:NitT/TauT family transport system ATP-binding protein
MSQLLARELPLPAEPAAVRPRSARPALATVPAGPGAYAEVAPSPLLAIEKLSITYEHHRSGELTAAVADIDLTINPGEFVSIVGLSGCGKTSLLNAVAGLVKYSSGSIAVAGKRVHGPGPDRSVVFQKATLLPWRTVMDNITYGLELQGVPRKDARRRAGPYIDLVQLRGFEHFHPGALSGGMQQRVNLARALVTDPALLLLDEPFAALDAITRETMQNELLQIWDATRKTVLMVTHQIDEAVLLSDRVIILSNRPAHVVAEIDIDLPRPRTQDARFTPAFDSLSKEIFGLIHQSVGVHQ